jgi:uncharacterized protein
MASVLDRRLNDAARAGDVAGLADALLAGADPNALVSGWTPLQRAALGDHVVAIAALLAAGARVDDADSRGTTPLLYAAYTANTATVDALLAAGADVHRADNNGDTALHWASQKGRLDAPRLLLDAGARTGMRNKEGKRPIDVVRAPPLARSMRLRVRVTMLRRHVAVRRRACTARSPLCPPSARCSPPPPPGPAGAPWRLPATAWSGSGKRKRGRLAVVDA